MNKNIIITGGLGFIGSNLIETLIKKKYFVVNIEQIKFTGKKFQNKKY